MDTAMEANLAATGRRPRTELDEEDYPQGGWDMVFLVALLLLGLPANGLMAWLAGSQARHGVGTRLAPLLLSLALSDFLFLAAAAFQILEIRHGGHWPLGTAACRFYYFLWGVSYSSSLFLLAALSLDRCLLVLCPRWYPRHRPARLPLWVCAGVWVLATLFSVPWLVFPEAIVWWYDLVICLDFWDSEELPLRMLEILGGFLPFLLLLTCHLLTQAASCRTCRRHRPQPVACHGFARVAKTILSAYVVLRLPYQLAQLLYLAFLWDVYPGYLLWEALVYSDYLVLLNSCLSPFLCLTASADLGALLRAVLASFAAALCEERPGSFTPAEPQTQVGSEGPSLPGPTAGTQPQQDPVVQPQANPQAQPQLDLVAQPQSDVVVQPQSDPAVPPQRIPRAQPQSDPVVLPQANPPTQPQSHPVVQPQANPPTQPQSDPVVQPQSDPMVRPQSDPVVQPQSDPMVQPQINPTVVQPQVNPPAQAQSDPMVQPQLDPSVVQPQVNPQAQPQSDPVVQPPLDTPVVQPQVDTPAQPQPDPVVPPQSSPETQTPTCTTELPPVPGEEASPSPSPDPTPGAPESPAMTAALEGESPSCAPPEGFPRPGPT